MIDFNDLATIIFLQIQRAAVNFKIPPGAPPGLFIS